MGMRRYDALDSMRGICACIVALFHFHTLGGITNFPLVRHGWMFVDFFFVLSGFVIASAYFDRLADGFSGWRFLALRVGRIYPLHIFILALLLVMELVLASGVAGGFAGRQAFSGGHGVGRLLAAVGLANAIGLSDGLGWNGPSWSIGAEMMAYMVFALLVGIFRRSAVPLFAIIGSGALIWLAMASPGWLDTTYQFGFVRCLYGFSLGVLLHAFIGSRSVRLGGRDATQAQFAMTLLVLAFVTLGPSGPLTLLAPILFAATIFVFAVGDGLLSRALQWQPLLMVGTLSYSIYLLHAVVQGRFMDLVQWLGQLNGQTYMVRDAAGSERLVVPGIGSDMLTLLMMAMLVGASWLTYRYVETPGRRLARKWVMQGRWAAPAASKGKAKATAY